MTRFERAYLSHNQLEWWYGHLSRALAERIAIQQYPMVRFNQPGHGIDSNIARLIDDDDSERAFYLGSIDQLFAGLADLPLKSAVWADWMPASGPKLLPCFGMFDVAFTSQKDSVDPLRRAGLQQVEWLPFAFDATLRNETDAPKIFDVGFVGSLQYPATRAERVEILSHLERRYVLNDYRQPVFGDQMMRIYNQSRIAVNIPVPGGFNMRTFEALAAGALLFTKAVANGQDDLFVDGRHFVTYRGTADLIDKIDYYLRHESERAGIAAEGMREVLTKHTYHHRAEQLLAAMQAAKRTRWTHKAARTRAYSAFYDYSGRADLLAGVALDRAVPLSERIRYLSRATVNGARLAINFRRSGGVGPMTGPSPQDGSS